MERRKRNKIMAVAGLLILCGGAIVAYCIANGSKNALVRQVAAMEGMNVDLAFSNAKAVYNGIDSVYGPTSKKKLVVFVDSTSCSGCFISHLIDYYETNDILESKNAELVVVLHPKQDRGAEIVSRLCNERFPFWGIVDEAGEFVSRNPGIPDNQLLHTFVLDEEDRIMLVGDPSRNPRIMELLRRQLNEN